MAGSSTTCVVCGRFSTRSSWNNTTNVGGQTYVACDFHTTDEFLNAANTDFNNSVTPQPSVQVQDPTLDESVNS